MKLSEKIKKLRTDNNMTQEDLATICFVSRNAVSKWENDLSYPGLDCIRIMCKHFNITIDELLNENELVQITDVAIEHNKKLSNKIIILLIFLLSLLYPFCMIAIREMIFWLDPTDGFAWYFLFAPILVVLLGALDGIVFKKFLFGLSSGIVGFGLTILFDINLRKSSYEFDVIYLILFIISILFTFLIKLGRFNKKSKMINQALSIIVFIATIFTFIKLYNRSIELQKIGQVGSLGPFNLVPVFYIYVFIIPLAFEVFWIVISFLKRKNS